MKRGESLSGDVPQDLQTPKNLKDPQRPATSTFVEHSAVHDAKADGKALLKALSLEQFISVAVAHCEDAEEAQRNDEDGRWRSPMWKFARLCKGHPSLMNLSDVEALRAVERTIRSIRFTDNPWEDSFPSAGDSESIRLDFMSCWSAIRWSPFESVLENAMRLAKEQPLRPPVDRGELYARFVSLAGGLQTLMGERRAILLPTRKLAEIFDCDRRTVSRLRKLAIADGLLTVVKPHQFHGAGRSAATEFRFQPYKCGAGKFAAYQHGVAEEEIPF